MEYTLRPATVKDIDAVFSLVEQRICWMDEKGIQQWNVTDYLTVYPKSYYQKQQALGTLYVLSGDTGGIVAGAVVLLQQDTRWPDKADPAFYVHNLVTDPAATGAGRFLLHEVECLAQRHGRGYVRLDCAVDNTFLNAYYSSMGYQLAGSCQDGLYLGNRREKKLVQIDTGPFHHQEEL